MAYRVITFRMQIHADHVKPDGAIMKLELANNLRGKRSEFALLLRVDMGFGQWRWRGVGVGAGVGIEVAEGSGFHFDDDDGVPVRRLCKDVDLAKAGAKVSSKNSVALLAEESSSNLFASLPIRERWPKATKEIKQVR